MQNLTIVVPFYNGHKTIRNLLDTIPQDLPVIIVDDHSPEPAPSQLLDEYPNCIIARPDTKGYFTGACNQGMALCKTDVLILNQDARLEGDAWIAALENNRGKYAVIGERIAGTHPAFAEHGYIHGTLMFIRRDAITAVGPMNALDYPLWGSTCEYQLRLCRAGFKVLPMRPFPGLAHDRPGRFGEAITDVLTKEPGKKSLFIRTPPEVSVIVPCHNHGKYLENLVNSLIGGETCLGKFKQQAFGSFEIVIVDDASTDKTPEYCAKIADAWKGIHTIRLPKNAGTAGAINAGVKASHGKYITIIAADDMREMGSLEKLYRAQLQNPHSFIYDQIVAFSGHQRRPDIAIKVSKFDAEKILSKNHVHAGIMFPRQAWVDCGGYPEVMRDGREDWAMNVNLTVHGYCGVFLPEIGYLYRREKQNRSLRNTTRQHWNLFKAKIMALFPEYYDGRQDIKMCCGQSNQKVKALPKAGSNPKSMAIPGGEGLVVLRYVGKSGGTFTFYGPVTGGQYKAGQGLPLVAVDPRDLRNKNPRTPGLLDARDGNKPVFVVEPVPQPQPAQVQSDTKPNGKIAEIDILAVETGKAVEVVPALVIDPSKMTALEIQKLQLDAKGWQSLHDLEGLGRKRKGVLLYAQAQIEAY